MSTAFILGGLVVAGVFAFVYLQKKKKQQNQNNANNGSSGAAGPAIVADNSTSGTDGATSTEELHSR